MVNNISELALSGTPDSGPSEYSTVPASVCYSESTHDAYESSIVRQPDLGLGNSMSEVSLQPYTALNNFPAFFEQVMLPGLEVQDPFQATQQPRAFDFMQDIDYTLADSDLFGTDFIPDLDKILDTVAPLPEFADAQQALPDDQESASRRAAAFQRSLW